MRADTGRSQIWVVSLQICWSALVGYDVHLGLNVEERDLARRPGASLGSFSDGRTGQLLDMIYP
jgi:hypothetical protein